MTGRQCHLLDLAYIPRGNDHTTAIRIRFDGIHDLGNLIDCFAIGSAPTPPLLTVDRPEVAPFISPFIPNAHAMFFQVSDIRVALQKPEEFVDDGFEVNLFGGQKGKSLIQVKSHLIAKRTQRAGTGSITFWRTVGEDVTEEILIIIQ